ncbi:MAG: FHA domain-containing protein [Pseudomonadota bacterium]
MELAAAGLSEQPFPTHGKPLAIVTYQAERAALEVLRETRESATGLSLIQGPSLSGKSTIIRTYLETLPEDYSVAVVNGKGLNTTNMLVAVLRQYGYSLDLSSANELLGLLRVFALQQAASDEPPMLIVENVHELNPSALRALCELAGLRTRTGSALKIVLVSDRSLQTLISASGMAAIADRLTHDFHLRPMSRIETKDYLHAKLRTAGSERPDLVFSDEACTELWEASGGWPGILDRLALLAIASTSTLPVPVTAIERPVLPMPTWDQSGQPPALGNPDEAAQPPHLVVTNNGSVLHEVMMEKARLLIGRSEHNDVAIGSRFISRHHAMLVRHGAATFLMDLNSTNGTYVNAKRISNEILRHEDVITLGHHKIKFYDPFATSRDTLDGPDFADTAIMKTLEDMRNLLARENTELMPAASEDLPTLQT